MPVGGVPGLTAGEYVARMTEKGILWRDIKSKKIVVDNTHPLTGRA